jgi:alpha-beta hydrolase superfamily lysophospholipase
MTAARRPVVFVHGMWLHSKSWTPWVELFDQAGYEAIAPGWPGEPISIEELRRQPGLVANTSINDITAHYTKIIHSLETDPITVGHSFGGLIAEKLIGQGVGIGAVAIDPAQI